MKRPTTTMLFWLLCSSALLASSERLGAVSGRIYKAETREGLVGASISILGTVRGAVTNDSGHFVIGSIPPGKYSALVSMIFTHDTTVRNLEVVAGETTTLEVGLWDWWHGVDTLAAQRSGIDSALLHCTTGKIQILTWGLRVERYNPFDEIERESGALFHSTGCGVSPELLHYWYGYNKTVREYCDTADHINWPATRESHILKILGRSFTHFAESMPPRILSLDRDAILGTDTNRTLRLTDSILFVTDLESKWSLNYADFAYSFPLEIRYIWLSEDEYLLIDFRPKGIESVFGKVALVDYRTGKVYPSHLLENSE